MNGPTLPKIFIFNEKIDSGYLYDLYMDDYPYMEEVFGITLQHYGEDLEAIRQAWVARNLPELKRTVHKMKPAFGFVGLTRVQQECAVFENRCLLAAGPEELKAEYQQIIGTLAASKELLESEYLKLKEFNGSSL